MSKVRIERKCICCGQNKVVEMDSMAYLRWMEGDIHIQDVAPELSEDDRELLISGVCGPCFGEMFGEDFEQYVKRYARSYCNGDTEVVKTHALVKEVKKQYEQESIGKV